MDTTGAYGGGKAGGAFDPQAFIQRPPVIVRAVCWVRGLACDIIAPALSGSVMRLFDRCSFSV